MSSELLLATIFGGTLPPGTCSALVQRVTPARDQQRSQNVVVCRIPREALATPLPRLAPGGYRLTCIGPGGGLRGGTRLIEVDASGRYAAVARLTLRDDHAPHAAPATPTSNDVDGRLQKARRRAEALRDKVARRDAALARAAEAHRASEDRATRAEAAHARAIESLAYARWERNRARECVHAVTLERDELRRRIAELTGSLAAAREKLARIREARRRRREAAQAAVAAGSSATAEEGPRSQGDDTRDGRG